MTKHLRLFTFGLSSALLLLYLYEHRQQFTLADSKAFPVEDFVIRVECLIYRQSSTDNSLTILSSEKFDIVRKKSEVLYYGDILPRISQWKAPFATPRDCLIPLNAGPALAATWQGCRGALRITRLHSGTKVVNPRTWILEDRDGVKLLYFDGCYGILLFYNTPQSYEFGITCLSYHCLHRQFADLQFTYAPAPLHKMFARNQAINIRGILSSRNWQLRTYDFNEKRSAEADHCIGTLRVTDGGRPAWLTGVPTQPWQTCTIFYDKGELLFRAKNGTIAACFTHYLFSLDSQIILLGATHMAGGKKVYLISNMDSQKTGAAVK